MGKIYGWFVCSAPDFLIGSSINHRYLDGPIIPAVSCPNV